MWHFVENFIKNKYIISTGDPFSTLLVLKFAFDTKVLRNIYNDIDKQHLQNDLDKLVTWSEK